MEPWEIELRNQLGGVQDTQPQKKAEAAAPAPQAEPQPQPQQPVPAPEPMVAPAAPRQQSSTSSFLAALVFLAVVTLLVYDHKNGGRIKSKISGLFVTKTEAPEKPRRPIEPKREEPKPSPQPQAQPQPQPEKPKVEAPQSKGDLEALRSENKAQIDALNKRLDAAANKLKLMGLMVNENFNIIGQQISDSFIYMNSDWTLDRMPRYLDLSPEDRQYLEQYVRQTSKSSKP